jgi:putative ABC transport system permease protein
MLWLELAWQSAWSRKHTLLLAITSVALSVMILLGVQQLREDTRNSFSNALSGVDLVVGPKGSATELMLYSVFQIGQPGRNIDFAFQKKIEQLKAVAWTIPIQLGDSYNGHPVIATTAAIFAHYRANERALEFSDGKAFFDPNRVLGASEGAPKIIDFTDIAQVVLGANVAKQRSKKLNDSVSLTHGKDRGPNSEHDELTFKVVGILKPTGTPLDNAVLMSLQGFETIHKDWSMGVRLPGKKDTLAVDIATLTPNQLTAIWIGLASRLDVFNAKRAIESLPPKDLMAVMPGVALDELWQIVRIVENALILIGAMVALSALTGVVSVLLVSLSARRRELAIYRALGARPQNILLFIGLESLGVCLLGIGIGLASTQVWLLLLQPWVQANYGIQIQLSLPTSDTWISLGAICVASLVASAFPAWRAYRLSLADGLTPPIAG